MRRVLKAIILLLVIVVSIGIIWGSNHLGLWWITAVIGLCFGLFIRRSMLAFGSSVLVALGGWGLDLLWQSHVSNIGGAANVIAGIVGIGVASGYLVILLALLFAILLGFTGAWAGAALSQTRRTLIAAKPLRDSQYY